MIDDPVSVQATFARDTLLERSRILRRRLTSWGASDPPRRPVFILGCPRSGTTLLFSILRQHPGFQSLQMEGHVLWNAYQHPRFRGWSSDRVKAEDVRDGEPRYLYGAIRRISGGLRFLDKTPKNVIRIPYLARLFPDCMFVFLKRDGRATVSSLIEGWKARRGLSYRLPEPLRLAEYRGRLWSYILPPDWRGRADTSIAEVAAFQYVTSNETALADARHLDSESFVEVAFEDLLDRPEKETRRLLERLELPLSERVMDVAKELQAHLSGAISPPRPGKWRDRADEIDRVFPELQPTMAHLGYDTDVDPR